MQLAEAKILCNSGALVDATLFRSEDGGGWCLKFTALQNTEMSLFLETQKKTIRVFKTTDAAFLILESIGLKEASILL